MLSAALLLSANNIFSMSSSLDDRWISLQQQKERIFAKLEKKGYANQTPEERKTFDRLNDELYPVACRSRFCSRPPSKPILSTDQYNKDKPKMLDTKDASQAPDEEVDHEALSKEAPVQ